MDVPRADQQTSCRTCRGAIFVSERVASRRPSNFGRIHLNPRCQNRNPRRCECGLECDFNETPVFYKAINVADEDAAHLIRSPRKFAYVYHEDALIIRFVPRWY